MKTKIYTVEEVKKIKSEIDKLTHIAMADLQRHAPAGHPYFDTSLPFYEHFAARFEKLGGMTPAISKALGWLA
jgi:hypothetical protein